MMDGKTVLAIIPARGGSKGIPHKNIAPVAGRPLIGWTIDEANKSRYIDRLILSSEDAEIIAVAKGLGCECPFVRPAELARDETPGIEPVLHALKALAGDYDYVCLLQPTSPLRTADDIDGCIETCIRRKANVCVSVTDVPKSPYWTFYLDEDERLTPFLQRKGKMALRRQDAPKLYALNGAVYVANVGYLKKHRSFMGRGTIGYYMPLSRSCDIDTPFDLWLCAALLTEKQQAGVLPASFL
jgi:CMP-N,N'-diacetyllegionaminic acid synthase